jgi:hypothetical protein
MAIGHHFSLLGGIDETPDRVGQFGWDVGSYGVHKWEREEGDISPRSDTSGEEALFAAWENL